MSSAGIGTAVFFVIFTDESVKSTDMSVRIAYFKKKEKSVILTDISVNFTGYLLS